MTFQFVLRRCRCLRAMSAAHGQAVLACMDACDASGVARTDMEWQLAFAGIAAAALWGQDAVMGDPRLQAVTTRCLRTMSQASCLARGNIQGGLGACLGASSELYVQP